MTRVGFDHLVISDLGDNSFKEDVGTEARFQETKENSKVRLQKDKSTQHLNKR